MNTGEPPSPDPALRSVLARESVRFLLVGAAGLLIDTGVTYAAIYVARLDPLTARLPAFLVAVTSVWLLNRSFTFGVVERRGWGEWGRFVGVYVIGAAINFVIYSLVIRALPMHPVLPVLAIGAGQTVAIVWNFLGARRFAFGKSLG